MPPHYQESLKLCLEALLYYKHHDDEQAKNEFTKHSKNSRHNKPTPKLSKTFRVGDIYQMIGECFTATGEFGKAETFLKRALQSYKSGDSYDLLKLAKCFF